MSYAIIGANWAVFGSTGGIFSSTFAKLSIGITIAFLGLNLALTRVLVHLLKKHFYYAEANPARWNQEFEDSKGKAVHWPSTERIDDTADVLTEMRTWLPLAAGLLLILGIILPNV